MNRVHRIFLATVSAVVVIGCAWPASAAPRPNIHERINWLLLANGRLGTSSVNTSSDGGSITVTTGSGSTITIPGGILISDGYENGSGAIIKVGTRTLQLGAGQLGAGQLGSGTVTSMGGNGYTGGSITTGGAITGSGMISTLNLNGSGTILYAGGQNYGDGDYGGSLTISAPSNTNGGTLAVNNLSGAIPSTGTATITLGSLGTLNGFGPLTFSNGASLSTTGAGTLRVEGSSSTLNLGTFNLINELPVLDTSGTISISSGTLVIHSANNIQVAPVPEPASIVLGGLALAALLLAWRSRG